MAACSRVRSAICRLAVTAMVAQGRLGLRQRPPLIDQVSIRNGAVVALGRVLGCMP